MKDEFGISPEMWGAAIGGRSSSGERTRWLQESRYGMFIHWGLYSKLAGSWNGQDFHGIGEWIQCQAKIPSSSYAGTAASFNPKSFNPDEWVKLAQDAGMRYMVLTAKHHEGFAMFKSAVSSFNAVDASPFGKDPVAMLAEACRKAGMPLGFYYSQTQDWHEPDALGNSWDEPPPERDFQRYLNGKARPQIKELLSSYGEVALIWFDTPGPITAEQSKELLEDIRDLQPNCLLNSRIGNGLGDYETLGDQEIPRAAQPGVWESVDTHNDTWGFVAHDANWKSPREIAMRLIRVIAKGGNYTLNVGPDGEGKMPELSASILREAGDWIKAHSKAIYGTEASPLGKLPWGECSRKGKRLFLHVFDWPSDGTLVVPGFFKGDVKASVQNGDGRKLPVETKAGHLLLHVPAIPPDSFITVLELDCEEPPSASPEQLLIGSATNLFDAHEAELSGCELGKRSWMEKFGDWKHAEFVSSWKPCEATAKWSFKALERGLYGIDIQYSSPFDENADGLWSLSIGNECLEFPLPPSCDEGKGGGKWPPRARFRTCRAGVAPIQSGEGSISLSPLSDECGQVCVESISLTPLR